MEEEGGRHLGPGEGEEGDISVQEMGEEGDDTLAQNVGRGRRHLGRPRRWEKRETISRSRRWGKREMIPRPHQAVGKGDDISAQEMEEEGDTSVQEMGEEGDYLGRPRREGDDTDLGPGGERGRPYQHYTVSDHYH